MQLESTRLRLRPWKLSDFEAFAAHFSIDTHTRFIGGVKKREDAWRLMATYVGHMTLMGYGYMAIEEKATHHWVGAVGLWHSDPWPEMELGYWLIPEMQGKGYASEAASRMKSYAFDVLAVHTLVSYIHPANEASKKVAQRLGGVYERDIELLDFGIHQVYRYGA